MKTVKEVLIIFTVWRLSLFLAAAAALIFIPIFGARFPYKEQVLEITGLPEWVWGFGNFDGVHYLRIAQNGYDAMYSQAFFPLYPLIIRFAGEIFSSFKNINLDTNVFVDPVYFISGLLISNVALLPALFFYIKLIQLDLSEKIALRSVIFLLAFPTAFYFGSIYTESLFLLWLILTFYFLRKNNYLLSGVFILLASSTKFVGLILIVPMLIEVILSFKNDRFNLKSSEFTKAVIGLLIAPLGLLFYMLYLRLNFENPLYFLTSQPFFGASRSGSEIILLPQVIFRYFKIFLSVPINSLAFLNSATEFLFTIGILAVLLLGFKKIRLSYFIFTLLVLLIPTLSGTLSSMPRYVLASVLVFPFLVNALGKYFKYILILLAVGQVALLSMFIRGYWVA